MQQVSLAKEMLGNSVKQVWRILAMVFCTSSVCPEDILVYDMKPADAWMSIKLPLVPSKLFLAGIGAWQDRVFSLSQDCDEASKQYAFGSSWMWPSRSGRNSVVCLLSFGAGLIPTEEMIRLYRQPCRFVPVSATNTFSCMLGFVTRNA